MLRGLYTAYTGMLNEQYRMDIMSNNLANADTTGFKKETPMILQSVETGSSTLNLPANQE